MAKIDFTRGGKKLIIFKCDSKSDIKELCKEVTKWPVKRSTEVLAY